eukprot:3316091-Rhodomonas_salina.3
MSLAVSIHAICSPAVPTCEGITSLFSGTINPERIWILCGVKLNVVSAVPIVNFDDLRIRQVRDCGLEPVHAHSPLVAVLVDCLHTDGGRCDRNLSHKGACPRDIACRGGWGRKDSDNEGRTGDRET